MQLNQCSHDLSIEKIHEICCRGKVRGVQKPSKIEFLDKGWSTERKYYIEEYPNRKLLLRIAPINEYDRKAADYERLKRVSRLDLIIPKPLGFGLWPDGKHVYTLVGWVEGKDAETELREFTDTEQYNFGTQAGSVLRKIHSIKAPPGTAPWENRYTKKIKTVFKRYRDCPIKIKGDKEIIRFIESNIHYLKGRETAVQHGDFHVGNLLITRSKRIGVIDFNRSSYGDPWEEYDRYIFTWRVSPSFATGQIYAYFDGKVPENFFRLMALYNATNMLASIPWAVPFGEDEVETMMDNACAVRTSYKGFSSFVPDWYGGGIIRGE